MSFLLPSPPLRRLMALKLRGAARRQLRRLKTPTGALFALLGFGLLLMWLGTTALTVFLGMREPADPAWAQPLARAGLGILWITALTGSLAHRGLYLPPAEIERFFSAPLERADLVRYRLWVHLGRALFGGLFFAFIAASRLPDPPWAATAAFLAVITQTLLGQAAAFAIGQLEGRLPIRFIQVGARTLFIGALLLLGFGMFYLLQGGYDVPAFREVAEHPAVRLITLPIEPFVQLATGAESLRWLFLLGALAYIVVLFEGVARWPVDFRELALSTSADVAKRLRRLQRGGAGASSGQARATGLFRRIPWLFGRGPLGAIAWRKTGSMFRRARATLGLTLLVTLVCLMIGRSLVDELGASALADIERGVGGRLRSPQPSRGMPVLLLGLVYLTVGLRFDFREDIDRIDQLKALPVTAGKLFWGTLLPQWAWVVALGELALALLVFLAGGFDLPTGIAMLALPGGLALWMALDNALFLLWPIRVIPGQEGAVQNMGRNLVLLFLRVLLFTALLALTGALGWFGWWLGEEWDEWPPVLSAVLLGSLPLAGFLWITGTIGASLLRRFDPSRLDVS